MQSTTDETAVALGATLRRVRRGRGLTLGTSAVELLAGEPGRKQQVHSDVLTADEGVIGPYSLEFLAVIDGVLVLDLGERTHELHPGDSATIASGTPHRWRSPDGTPYRLFIVKERQDVARSRAELRRATAVVEDCP